MKRGFKSALATLGLVLSVSTIQAQTAEKSVFDNLSVEAQYGYNSAMSPKNDIVTSDYSGFNFFQLGLTYHIDDVWGVRGTFASSNFKNVKRSINETPVTISEFIIGRYVKFIIAFLKRVPDL